MKILQMDSPLMHFLGKIADIVIVNLLTILCCIPVITAGASFTAMHYCCLKIVRNEESSIAKQFFHSFKDNFKQSTIIWLIMMAFIAFFTFDFVFLYTNPDIVGSYVFWGLVLVVAVFAFISCMVFPIQAKFANPIPKTLKISFVFAFRHLIGTIATIASSILVVVLMYYVWPILPLLLCTCFSGPGMVCALFYNKHFKKLEDKYYEEHPSELPNADDEHIFSDEENSDEENAD